MQVIVRILTATRRIKPGGYVGPPGVVAPFTLPPGEGEQDVAIEREHTVPPATADGRQNWDWCRLNKALTVAEVDPALVPPRPPSLADEIAAATTLAALKAALLKRSR